MKITREAFADEASWLEFQHNLAELERQERLRQAREAYKPPKETLKTSRSLQFFARCRHRDAERQRRAMFPDLYREYWRRSDLKNHDVKRARGRAYYQRHRDEILMYNAVWRRDHREEIREYRKLRWRVVRSDPELHAEWLQKLREYRARRRATDPSYRERKRREDRRYRANPDHKQKHAEYERNKRHTNKEYHKKQVAAARVCNARKREDAAYREDQNRKARERYAARMASDPEYRKQKAQRARQRLADDPTAMAKHRASSAAYQQRYKADPAYKERHRIEEAARRARKKTERQEEETHAYRQ